MNQATDQFAHKGASMTLALALVLTAAQATAGTPIVVISPPLDRNANLLVNGSFEEGHPGVVAGPSGSLSAESVYWALDQGGLHNPIGRGLLSSFPANVELTPPGWIGSGGVANYAEWSREWPGIVSQPTGPALSSAPSVLDGGVYSLYFGNYYIMSLDVPQNRIDVRPDGEWVFQDSAGERIDPLIVPGQPINFVSPIIPAQDFRPEVRLSQTVTDLCVGATYGLSFMVFGEYGHPTWIEETGLLAADGFFGLDVSGYDTLYLTIPAASGFDLSGNSSPLGAVSDYTYAVEFVATGPEMDITFINWGHFNRSTRLGGNAYVGPPGITQTSELVLDDVILNQLSSCTCDLRVDKTCRVDPPPSTISGECDGKLQQFTLAWNGAAAIDNISVVSGAGTSAAGPVNPGDEITVFGPFTDNDVILSFTGGINGQSKFHVSCSDDDFNSSEDCGKSAGDGKGSNSGFDNTWLLEGFVDKNGDVLDCTPESSGDFTDHCSYPAPPAPSCARLKDAGDDLSSLTFVYTGEGCPGNNSQDPGKVSCSGSVDGALPVAVSSPDDLIIIPGTVMPSDAFTLSGNFSSSTEIMLSNGGGSEAVEFHTSCSQPIAVGDSFGSIEVVAINGQDGGADVTYRYQIDNHGDPLTDVQVSDNLLGSIGAIASLGTGESETLSVLTRIAGTTVNIGTAVGTLPDGNVCGAGDTVTVEALAPTCLVSVEFYKLDDDKIKFKLTNSSSITATLESFVLDFPPELGLIKEIKLDGAIYKRSESSLDVGPGVTVMEGDWTQSDLAKRQLEPDESRTLEVVFTDKSDEDAWLGTINDIGGVTFSEGCMVAFPDVPLCAIGKPTALSFEYTGDACGATTNTQEGKLQCAGDPMGQAPVSIVMTKDANKFTVTPAAGIGLNQTFEIARTDHPGDDFPSEIEFQIRSGGQSLQSLKIHASCSKELNIDDQFGGVIVRGFIPAY